MTKEDISEVGGIKCTKTVKNLGVKVTCDRQEQLKISKEQIDKDINILRCKIGRGAGRDTETCICLVRSMLIYIGTPLMAVGLWKREDIDRAEASLYHKIIRICNEIPNFTVLNTMTITRLPGEVIYYLSSEAWS